MTLHKERISDPDGHATLGSSNIRIAGSNPSRVTSAFLCLVCSVKGTRVEWTSKSSFMLTLSMLHTRFLDEKAWFFCYEHLWCIIISSCHILRVRTNYLWSSSMKWSRGCSVGIVTELQSRRPGFDSRQGQEFLSLHHSVQTGAGVHPASYKMGTGGFFLWGKGAGAWSWPVTAYSAEVKSWRCTSMVLQHGGSL
jgi:hypothetical protein